jgi:hypothetical protein
MCNLISFFVGIEVDYALQLSLSNLAKIARYIENQQHISEIQALKKQLEPLFTMEVATQCLQSMLISNSFFLIFRFR